MAETPNMVPQAVESAEAQPMVTDTSSLDAAQIEQILAADQAAGGYTSTTVSSLGDLKNKAPKIYKFMILSLAQNMVIQMQHDQDTLTQMWRDMRRDQQG